MSHVDIFFFRCLTTYFIDYFPVGGSRGELPRQFVGLLNMNYLNFFRRLMVYCCYILWDVSPCILPSICRTPHDLYRIFYFFFRTSDTYDGEYSRCCFGGLNAHYLDILSSVYMKFPDISSFVSAVN